MWGLAAALTLGAAAASPVSAASFPPELRFHTLVTDRVLVHYHDPLEPLARQAASLAGEILAADEARYGTPVPRVHLILADVDDSPNGFATPFPYPVVEIRVVAPDGTDDFGNHGSWLRMVLTHELAHIVHLERARGIPGFGRKLFGRAPFLFPNTLTPTWMIEGLATLEETRGTAFGRGRNPDSRMVVRMAALDGDFPGEDRPVRGLDRWPDGEASYLFGEAFLAYLSQHWDPRVVPALTRVHAGHLIPYLDDLTAAKVTGQSFHALWRGFRAWTIDQAKRTAARIEGRGLTPSRALTHRGIRQIGPRFSPNGGWIAYTSRSLDRFPEIRLVRPDGSGDHAVARRNGGTRVSWTSDGRRLVFDEPEIHHLFRSVSDLRVLDLASGKVRKLSRGLRASDPDVAPDGRVVFVRQYPERTELAVMRLDGSGLRDLTRSAPGTEWSAPRWSPDGRRLAASRLTGPGFLDLVTVDPATGAVTPWTRDRAKDVEPAWDPEGRFLVFRSDRDGVSNVYACRLEDDRLFRVTNVLGGAFGPDVSPDGARLVYSSYSSRGYDVQIAALDLAALPRADAFHDPYPESPASPKPWEGEVQPYRPFPAMLPRFWSPYAGRISGEFELGVVTAGADPLRRHVYGLDLHHGSETGRVSVQGVYQYDRLWPTFLLYLRDVKDPEQDGSVLRTSSLRLQASLPLVRTVRHAHSLSLAFRRERQTIEDAPEPGRLDLGGVEAAWTFASLKQYPYSVSPVEGARFRIAFLEESAAFGSDVDLGKLTGKLDVYTRVFGAEDALAVQAGAGTTFGAAAFQQSFAVGGFPDRTLLDVTRTNLALLRGYPDNAFRGRSFAQASFEYRFPLVHPQRGFRTLPLFVRSLHAAVFLDLAHAWSGSFRLADVKTGAGASLGTDVYFGHGLPLTFTLDLAHGFDEGGDTRLYFRTGLAF